MIDKNGFFDFLDKIGNYESKELAIDPPPSSSPPFPLHRKFNTPIKVALP